MALVVKDEGTDFVPLSAGTHLAICIGVHDVGIQPGKIFGDKHQCVIIWEVDERIPEGEAKGKRYTISKRYTVSLSDRSHLRKDMETWLNRKLSTQEIENGFDIETAVGKPCQLSVSHAQKGGRTYTNVEAVIALPKGIPALKNENALGFYPDWVKKLQQNAIKPVATTKATKTELSEQERLESFEADQAPW